MLPPSRSSNRLLSLDVFRGLTIVGMLIVNSPGNGTAFAPLEHAEWNGWTPTDLVFPFFLFIVGVSLVLSFSKRRQDGFVQTDLVVQIAKRTGIIFLFGLLLNGFPYNHLGSIRIPGVLQRISICYFFASLAYLYFRPRTLIALTAALLMGYWWTMTNIPVPGFGVGVLTKEGNLAAYIDRLVFAGHMYTPEYDPEGLFSTLPAIATTLIGVLTGCSLIRPDTMGKKTFGMFSCGLILVGAGLLTDLFFPINKALWTSSYVLFTAGAALIVFACLYGFIEIEGLRRGTMFFEVFGVNALFAYVTPLFLLKTLNRIPIAMPDGSSGNARLFFTHYAFEIWTTPMMASLLFALFHLFLWFFVLRLLYQKRLFIKI